MSIAEKFDEIAKLVYEKGRQDEWSDFWDSFQKNSGYMGNYASIFSYEHWDENNYNPKHTIGPTYSCNAMFYASHITDTKVTIDLRLCTYTNQMFLSAKKLKTIRKIIVKEATTYTSAFGGCSALENITFEGIIGQNISFADSPLLTVESMINDEGTGIINCLKDFVSEGNTTTCTLTLHADAKARLTDAQKAVATEKGWTLA